MQPTTTTRPDEALATLRQLYDTTTIYAFNAGSHYDFRQMLPPDLPEQCQQAFETLGHVVQTSEIERTYPHGK
jgi:hypothetical protein